MNKEEKSEALTIEEKNVPKEKKKHKGIASISLFVALFDRLGEIIYNALANGFFGKMFSSHTTLEEKFKGSLLGRLLFGNHGIRRFFRRLRQFLARNIESGFFANRCRAIMKYFCSMSLNSYGNFFMFFGIYTGVVYFLKVLIPELGSANLDDMIVGIVLFVVSLPMCFSRISLVRAVKTSVIGNMIFQGAFGFSYEGYEDATKKTKTKGNFMFLLGLIAGILTFFMSPIKIILAILGAVLVFMVASSPEVGVLLSIVILPFLSFFGYPTIILCVLLLCTAFFYLLKLIRGKRVFKFEILDAFILIFGMLVLFSSIFSAGAQASVFSALVTFTVIIGYFLTVNLMRTKKWAKRCVYALIGSGTVVGMIGIFEYFFAEGSSKWLDLSLFSNIKIRVVSLFENPNILAMFLVTVFPFVLTAFCLARQRNEKTLCLFVGIVFVVCTLFTWSRGAWIAMILASLIFFMIYTKKSFRIFGVLLFALPVLPMVIPDNVINRFLSITNLSDSSISYRIYTWKGTMRMIGNYFFGGIGFGNEAFQNIYPHYAYSGAEAAEHSHSLFLQIIAYMGILGLLIFAVVAFLSLQKSFEYIKNPESRESKLYVSAAVASMIAALVMGIFDYIWYNYRIMYVFWVVLAIGCAFVRIGKNEMTRKEDISSKIISN